ncbi:MAG: GNAT family N-acetyltransferase [Selenomonadaceae bacterium]|nr:GNAT family N-acetyltransferase [Selenomonadaceae bacterium]
MEIVDGINYLDEVKNLILEYTKFLGRDLTFQNLDDELSDLEKKYYPPNGRIICAQVEEKIIGCVAYRKFDAERCEMKRLFVLEGYRKFHAGSKLIEEILIAAKNDGYKEMILDTITPLESAIHLYKKFGFVETAPYYENPMSDVVYMKKILD